MVTLTMVFLMGTAAVSTAVLLVETTLDPNPKPPKYAATLAAWTTIGTAATLALAAIAIQK